MRLIIILFASIVFLAASCKKDKPVITPKDDITISSKTLGDVVYYSLGYSFELQDFVKTINTPDIIDIYLVKIIKISGELTGVQFATKDIQGSYGFFLNNTSANATDAEQFYNTYTTAVAPQFTTLTDTVRINQVWTFKTWKKNYVKFLVKDVRKVYSGSTVDYIEVDIKYFIQRDGSVNLME